MSIQAKLLHLQSIQNLLAPYRYLYCVDLEATCDQVDESESPRPLAVVPDQIHTPKREPEDGGAPTSSCAGSTPFRSQHGHA